MPGYTMKCLSTDITESFPGMRAREPGMLPIKVLASLLLNLRKREDEREDQLHEAELTMYT